MDENKKQKLLDAIIKRAQSGEMGLDPFIKHTGNIRTDVDTAVNLQEEALGKLALEQFEGRVPNKGASQKEIQNFLEGIREQYIPDVAAKIKVNPELKQQGIFDPSIGRRGEIEINPRWSKEQVTGTMLHEGLHARDYNLDDYGDLYDLKKSDVKSKLGKLAPDLVGPSGKITDPKKLSSLVASMDINDVKEALMEGHHGLQRGGTISNVNLKRLLKGMPLLGAGAALLMNPEDASAAVPGLSEADTVGESPEEEAALIGEIEGYKGYQKSPAKMDRLKKLMGR